MIVLVLWPTMIAIAVCAYVGFRANKAPVVALATLVISAGAFATYYLSDSEAIAWTAGSIMLQVAAFAALSLPLFASAWMARSSRQAGHSAYWGLVAGYSLLPLAYLPLGCILGGACV